MRTLRMMKTMVALILALCCFLPYAAFMEEAPSTADGFFSVSLESLTDEELEKIAVAILAEQLSRIKTHIVLDNNEITLNVGKSQKINAKIEDLPEGERTPKLEWSTSDKTIATCNNGTVRAVSAGEATITCSAILANEMQITAECTVTVTVPVSSITTDKRAITLDVTKSYSPVITIKPDNATDKRMKFSSSDSTVASVDSNGTITGKAQGKATITVTTADGSGKTITITVTVEDNRDSIGKRTAKVTGGTAKEMCEYISYEFTSLNSIVISKRNGSAIAESMFANLQNAERNFFSNRTCYMGVSKEDKRRMYMACCDIYDQYWMVIFEPDKNNITYSKDTKSHEDAVAFMEYNCISYASVTVKVK